MLRLDPIQVFFRAGVLGLMEEIREEKISEILSWLQATARGKLARQTFKKLKAQKVNANKSRDCREPSKSEKGPFLPLFH